MISLGESYPWGSNMTVANNAMMLLLAARFEPENGGQYVTAARDHVHYCFGRNPMATSYVTGCGTLTPLHPHHRPSEAKASPMPGMLVGGPDGALEDPYVKTTLAGKPPAVCYADNSQSFSTNEITIYWNSPLIFALSGVISYSDY